MRIRKHVEEINGRKHHRNNKGSHEISNQKGGLNQDFGMSEAKKIATSVIQTQ